MNGASAATLDYGIGTSQPMLGRRYVIASEPEYRRELSNLTAEQQGAVPTEGLARVVNDSKKVLLKPEAPVEPRLFRLLQLWEGKVTEVNGHDLTAVLTDKTNPDNDMEEVVIDREEVSEDDRSLLRPGAIFYWSIGYEDEPGCPRRRISQIRFRRLPGWTRRELDEAKQKAAELATLFM